MEGPNTMSNTVKLSSKLAADDDLNGLDYLASQMIENPRQVRIAVVWFDTVKIIDNTDDDSRIPYARIRRWESLGNVEDVEQSIRDIVAEAAEERTGKAPLPFEAAYEVED